LGDVEKLVVDYDRRDGAGEDEASVENLNRVRKVLRCVAKTERLMGGDRELY